MPESTTARADRARSPRSLEAFFVRNRCATDERRVCLEYLAFLRFKAILRRGDGLRFVLLALHPELTVDS